MSKKNNSAQLGLGLPGSSEVARPRRVIGAKDRTGYHWSPGKALPALGQHSIAKHDIYDNYVDRYISTLTKNHVQSKLKATIVDGFCGGGLYDLDGATVSGSPLRLIDAIEVARAKLKARREDFDLDVDFVFIDEKAAHIAYLRDELIRRGYGSLIGTKIRLVASTFEDAVPDVISAIRKKGRAHRSLFFLDQYGWSDVKLATVRRIMADLVNPEVVLTFMVDSLINLLHEKTSTLSALAAIDYTREDVRALLDMKDEFGAKGWKRAIQNTVYKHILECTGAAFYTPFFVHPPESHRDYWLIHLSKHHQAREEMGNVFWETTNTMEHFGGAGLNALGFDPSVDVRQGMMDYMFDDDAEKRSESQLLEQIPPLLHESWKGGGIVTKRSLFESRANDTPVVGKLVDSGLAKLRDEGEIVIFGRKRDKSGEMKTVVRERADQFQWDDEIRLPREPRLFSFLTNAA
ncbi:three-Cys-motif partner protein TcmP [Qipengyuania spongiae]|uniref:Three-Cys-motif partner protein TcmP n=1 Tax=Qipengyuania spongiae TaxID=2909673 RepID=A0ABY5SW64_9SPHN|nr:three-Cys-motif partner protein TcmP [Qipengyuania spongiae]UVI38390.1 three-Cys-motif partner protein TcmP [Qipengyuania spongiae]